MKTLALVAASLALGSTAAHACKFTQVGAQLADTADVIRHLGSRHDLNYSRLEAFRFNTRASVAVDVFDRDTQSTRTLYFVVSRGADCRGSVREIDM